MEQADLADVLGSALAGALEQKGYTTLTAVQLAVLNPALKGRDLRISSQTGSGKTVAVGLALRDLLEHSDTTDEPGPRPAGAVPKILVVVPTRELAKQEHEELGWLFAPLGVRIAVLTGGANYRDERRSLAARPSIVVGTPGRLLDQLSRGAVDVSRIGAVVLDEADRMLDMGFREELEAILAQLPSERRTLLMSATFPKQVEALANRVQRDPVRVEGTRLGAANHDIEHVLHLVDPDQRVDAIVNLLLGFPDDQALIFARTRADVADLAANLSTAGFKVSSLSGEMEQRDRDRALGAFKRGRLDALVATDVAARGLDVTDIGRVIHAELPGDVDTYTHRSGRTGRAGRKGTSSVLVTSGEVGRALRLLARAGVRGRFEPVPSAKALRDAADDRLYQALTEEAAKPTTETEAPAAEVTTACQPSEQSHRIDQLAMRLAASPNVPAVIARLLDRTQGAWQRQPRDVRVIAPPVEPRKTETRRTAAPKRASESRPAAGHSMQTDTSWVPFLVTWGEAHGADARRLLAIMCRRGGVRGEQIGAIRIGRTTSIVEVAGHVAEDFANAAQLPDARNPRMHIRPGDARATSTSARAMEGPPSTRHRPEPRPPLPAAKRHTATPNKPTRRDPPRRAKPTATEQRP